MHTPTLDLQAGQADFRQDPNDPTEIVVEVVDTAKSPLSLPTDWTDSEGLFTVDNSAKGSGVITLNAPGQVAGTYPFLIRDADDFTWLEGNLIVGRLGRGRGGSKSNGIRIVAGSGTVKVTVAQTVPIGTYAAVAKTPDTQFPRQHGAVPVAHDLGYRALTFGPSGQILSTRLSSASGRFQAVTTDDMETWTESTVAIDPTFGATQAWTLASGATLILAGSTLYRTTDIFSTPTTPTFTSVLSLGSQVFILSKGLTEDTAAGKIYIATYTTTVGAYPSGEARIYESSDDGATWSVHSFFPSTLDGASGDGAIRHLHSIHALPSGLWCTTGDTGTASGIWQWDGTQWVRQTPLDSTDGAQRWRAVSLVERDGHLYWGRDSGGTSQSEWGHAPVDDLSDYEQITTLPTGVFYCEKLSTGEIVFTGAAEGGAFDEDEYVRIWVCDNDDNISEAYKALRHSDAGSGPGEFGLFEALKIDASDRVLVNGTFLEWHKYGTVFEDSTHLFEIRHGASAGADELRPAIQPAARSSRSWKATASTSTPTTTSTTTGSSAAIIPEMEVTVQCSGALMLVIFTAQVGNTVVGANTSIGLQLGGGIPVGIRWMPGQGSGLFDEVTIIQLWQPDPGQRVVRARWWVSSGEGRISGLQRDLMIAELAP